MVTQELEKEAAALIEGITQMPINPDNLNGGSYHGDPQFADQEGVWE